MKHPLQPASHSGAVLRRTRRVDGVEVDRSLLFDAVRTLRTTTTPTAPVHGTPTAPREAAPGARERGDGVQASTGVRRGLRAAVAALGRRSRRFTSSSARRSRLGPKRLKNQKETTHRHDSWKRVASMA